jgi:hypothetical protein
MGLGHSGYVAASRRPQIDKSAANSMDYMVPRSGLEQLGLLLWAFPLMFWGVIFSTLWDGVQAGKRHILQLIGWCVAGAFVIGSWGSTIQSRAIELCG